MQELIDPVMKTQAEVDKLAFECQLTVKIRLRSSTVACPATSFETTATKFPKLEVPTFHGDILQGRATGSNFVSVHDHSNRTKSEKLVYLQNSIIEGLTRSGEHCDEAIKCLLSRYDRPHRCCTAEGG